MDTWGRPLRDFAFSGYFGVSQSKAGEVVEKQRESERRGKGVGKAKEH